MSRVPVITSPCPLRFKGSPQPGMDFCGHCQRRVHNLDSMSHLERERFLVGCSGEVCVSYTVKRRALKPLALGLGLAVLAVSTNAEDKVASPDSPYCDLENVIMGGTAAGKNLQWVDASQAALPAKPDLPDIDAASWLPTPKT